MIRFRVKHSTVLAWLLLSAAFEQGERYSGGKMGTWVILDSFEAERQCLEAATRVRQEAFRALEQVRQGRPVPTSVKEYSSAPWSAQQLNREFFIGRSRAACEKD